MGELDSKVALVTGAGQGIGQGIALALAKAGASVGLVGRRREPLEETAALIHAVGGKTAIALADVAVRAEVDAAVAHIEKELGPVWSLVNNAIATERQTLEHVTDENMDRTIRSGIYGSLYMMQACFAGMKANGGGRIFNFGSGTGTMGLTHNVAYSIAKEGVRSLAKVAASDWGKYNITANTICPIASTPLYDSMWAKATEAEKAAHLAEIPLRRIGDSEKDVGALVVFLSGPGGGYITSRTFHVDGGKCYYDR